MNRLIEWLPYLVFASLSAGWIALLMWANDNPAFR
jgi:hypothetical protein